MNNIDFSVVLATSVHDMKNSLSMVNQSIEQLLAENPSLDVGIDLSPEEVGEEIDQQEEVAAEETPTEKSPE